MCWPCRRCPGKRRRPNLPLSLAGVTFWSRTALRCLSRVSRPWRCAHQQPPVAYSPPAKPLQRRGPPSTSHLSESTRPSRRILEGRQLNPPRTTAISGKITCLLPPPAGGPLKQNRAKIIRLILAVLRSSPPLPVFGNVTRVALWGSSSSGRRVAPEGATFFGRKDDLGINLQERGMRIIYAVRIAANRCSSAAAGSKMPCR